MQNVASLVSGAYNMLTVSFAEGYLLQKTRYLL